MRGNDTDLFIFTQTSGMAVFDILEMLQKRAEGTDRHESWPYQLNQLVYHHKRNQCWQA